MNTTSTSKEDKCLSSYAPAVAKAVKTLPGFFVSLVFRLAVSVRVDEFFVGFKDKRGDIIADLEEGYGSSSAGNCCQLYTLRPLAYAQLLMA